MTVMTLAHYKLTFMLLSFFGDLAMLLKLERDKGFQNLRSLILSGASSTLSKGHHVSTYELSSVRVNNEMLRVDI